MSFRNGVKKVLGEYGMLVVLLLLVLLFSLLTITPQNLEGKKAADALASHVEKHGPPLGIAAIVARDQSGDRLFADALRADLASNGVQARVIVGEPHAIRSGLDSLAAGSDSPITLYATSSSAALLSGVLNGLPGASHIKVVTPPAKRWPTFLLPDNLRNIANQISVIAIIAIGMTMVIVTAGIDLSVGSLIALAAVVAAWLIGRMGGSQASTFVMILGCLGAVAVAGGVGLFSGAMITRFRIPPFIATLAMMQVASGLAYIISRGRPIYQLPTGFVTLGRGVDPLIGLPWAVWLMLILYFLAHLVMSRTVVGRAIYAVGGNEEAARLAGIRVKRVLLGVYTLSGLLAGVGGIVMASQLRSGAPTYGLMYELYVIAAVVVGGASLMGGEGKVFGTLIGAFIIAVIQNGMNLTNVESYTQKVVLGLVILGAVLLDRIKHTGWHWSLGFGSKKN